MSFYLAAAVTDGTCSTIITCRRSCFLATAGDSVLPFIRTNGSLGRALLELFSLFTLFFVFWPTRYMFFDCERRWGGCGVGPAGCYLKDDDEEIVWLPVRLLHAGRGRRAALAEDFVVLLMTVVGVLPVIEVSVLGPLGFVLLFIALLFNFLFVFNCSGGRYFFTFTGWQYIWYIFCIKSQYFFERKLYNKKTDISQSFSICLIDNYIVTNT